MHKKPCIWTDTNFKVIQQVPRPGKKGEQWELPAAGVGIAQSNLETSWLLSSKGEICSWVHALEMDWKEYAALTAVTTNH
jgi:hypothetical protein